MGFNDKDTKFVASYQSTNNNSINIEIPLENGTCTYATDLKTVQLGKSLYKTFEEQLYQGQNFTEENYLVTHPTQKIPIILGYDYLQYYNIGDTLELSLHQKNLLFEVIGFYQKETSFQFENSKISLDQCIIMPFYDIAYDPIDANDESYQKIYYSQKNEGYIHIPDNVEQTVYRTNCDKKLNELKTQK